MFVSLFGSPSTPTTTPSATFTCMAHVGWWQPLQKLAFHSTFFPDCFLAPAVNGLFLGAIEITAAAALIVAAPLRKSLRLIFLVVVIGFLLMIHRPVVDSRFLAADRLQDRVPGDISSIP
jgi:hypothetical protein